MEFVEDQLGIENLYEAANTPLVGYLNNALKAKELYKRDRDYIVREGEVLIVDEFTGRVLAGRRYNEGMHQAIEAKEGVQIQQENQTLATITLQNYFRLYSQAVRDDRYRADRGRRAAPDLQAGRGADPDQPADDPRRRHRPDLQDRGRQVRRGGGRHRRAARQGPAGAGRYRQRGQVRDPGQSAAATGDSARGAQRQAARAGGRDRGDGRPQGRGHGGHQHGRPRYRHHAGRQPGVHRRRRAARAGAEPGRHPGGVRGGLAGRHREGPGPGGPGARRGRRAGRAVRAGHRAARVPPDRQPAARPVRPAGRPGRVPVLPVAGRRPDGAVQRRADRHDHEHAPAARGHPDREQDGFQGYSVRADPGRAAELRDPQERAQVRRGAEQAAHGDLRRAPDGAGRCRPVRPDPADDHRRGHLLRRGRDVLGLPGGVGPGAALGGAEDAVPDLADHRRGDQDRRWRPRTT